MDFNIENMQLDTIQKRQFEEFVQFKLGREEEFSFLDFNKICGVSRQQWEMFKGENKDLGVSWRLD